MPRRIVLLSDGTGNSSASFWRTNVWRMFQSLDLSANDQVACYDDGVGTSSFKPLAVLGGAFGWGLKRNVISLYCFACRNYRSETDELYAFGFSRGAFTIRVLIGLIVDQGLAPANDISDTELQAKAAEAYRAYKSRHFHTNWWLIYQRIKQLFGRKTLQLPPGPYPVPKIRFLGLWDTVAAYGLPVDEMTRGVSQWLIPLELPNHTLSSKVDRACHALSLDDERTTFHPVLWDESAEPKRRGQRLTTTERLVQVWFAGVHANVGGGYPDDSLAQIPLYWIMQEAKACGLVFKEEPNEDPDAVLTTRSAQDKDGRLYNSRSGLGMYYRFGPRRLSRICNQSFSTTTNDKVEVLRPKIHESVFARIKNHAHVYAPIGIPENYEIVRSIPDKKSNDATFQICPIPPAANRLPAGTYETENDALARVHEERRSIWPTVYLRAFIYFLTVLLTLVIVIFPTSGRPDPLGELSSPFRWLSDLIRTLSGFLPGWISQWLKGYAEYPVTFAVFVALWAILFTVGSRLASRTADQMTALWTSSLQHSLTDPGNPQTAFRKLGRWLVSSVETGWKQYIAPALSALIIVCGCLVVVSHFAFNAFDDAGFTCKSAGNPVDVPKEGVLISFQPSELCFASGYKVARLDKYLVWTNPSLKVLSTKYAPYATGKQTCGFDHSPPLVSGGVLAGDIVTEDGGYSTFHNREGKELTWSQTAERALLTPLRRSWSRPWFQLIARYGVYGGEEEFLDPDPDSSVRVISEYVQPKIAGELFFYVNDAVIGIPGKYDAFYRKNSGCISVFIKPK